MYIFSFLRTNLWEKLEEIAPDNWDEFSELFSRQIVVAKPVKPKSENKPAKQQTVKSWCIFNIFAFYDFYSKSVVFPLKFWTTNDHRTSAF